MSFIFIVFKRIRQKVDLKGPRNKEIILKKTYGNNKFEGQISVSNSNYMSINSIKSKTNFEKVKIKIQHDFYWEKIFYKQKQ